MSDGAKRPRRGRWLVAGGLLGLVVSPQAAPYRRAVIVRAMRWRAVADPVASFTQAPCYRTDASEPLQEADRAEVTT